MQLHKPHTRKADAAIAEAMIMLRFTPPDVPAILKVIDSKKKKNAISTALVESRSSREKACTCTCDACLKEYIRQRLQNMKDSAGRRAVLNTGGKKKNRTYVWIEGLAWESYREGGLVSKDDAIEKLQAFLAFRADQKGRLSAAEKSLKEAIRLLKADNYITERPAIYDEIQGGLFDIDPAA